MISDCNIPPQYLGGKKTQQDSIQRTGMSYNKKKMNDRGFHWWCFMADVWKDILMRPDVSQVPILHTKEVDVVYVKLRWDRGEGR